MIQIEQSGKGTTKTPAFIPVSKIQGIPAGSPKSWASATINADRIVASETDRFGNLVGTKEFPLVTYGKSTDQATALICEVAKELVAYAAQAMKPVFLEKLGFSKKKAGLRNEKPKYARMLSSFSYNKIIQAVKSRAFRFGVEVLEVNPAYTSMIGLVNHSRSRGISVHQAASFSIARRGSGFHERPIAENGSVTIPTSKGDHVTFPVPVRNRGKHVWKLWSAVQTSAKAVLAAHFRPPQGDPSKLRKKPSLGKCPIFTVKPRNANRQQHCSAGVMEDIPW